MGFEVTETLKKRVYDVLVSDAKAREHDHYLYVAVMRKYYESQPVPFNMITLDQVFDDIEKEVFGNIDSMSRARRMLNSDYSETRGSNYEFRQQKQHEVRKQFRKAKQGKMF